jgi:signal transduction histidine kinase
MVEAMGETGWRGPGTAADRVDVMLIRAAALLRAVQLAVWLPVPLSGGLGVYRTPALVLGGFIAAVLWTAVLFWLLSRLRHAGAGPFFRAGAGPRVRAGAGPFFRAGADRLLRATRRIDDHGDSDAQDGRRAGARGGTRRAESGLIWADVVLTVASLLLVPAACTEQCAPGMPHWILPPAMGSAIVAAGFLHHRQAVAAVGTLTVAYVLGSASGLDTSAGFGAVAHNSVSMIAFAALAALVVGHLRQSARELDAAGEAAREASASEAAARARLDERTLQYDRLHQTVLTTLSLIARGRLDHRTEEVRALAQRDADYLRGLVTAGFGPAANLATALAEVVRDKQALGLQVHSQFHDLREMPEPVELALTNAVREALTNVDKHAGTDEAWLTAIGDADGVIVRVVDRGRGFRPESVAKGRGLLRELNHCMVEVGGVASVDSAPAQGTIVEVSWKRISK